jgi:hypothetical protein
MTSKKDGPKTDGAYMQDFGEKWLTVRNLFFHYLYL